MAEELPARGVDAIGAAAVIHLVEVELEDLVLAELTFQRERQDPFAEFAPELLLVVQEDVARQLLRDRRSALHPAPAFEADLHRPRDADRVDARMSAEPAILDRDGRLPHDPGDLRIGQPFAIARPQRGDDAAVGGMDADHLAVGRAFQLVEARQLRACDIDRDHQRAEGEDAETDQNLEGNDDPPAPTRAGGGSGAGGARTSHGGARDYALPGRVTSTRASRRADLRGRCDRWRLSPPPASRWRSVR